ncbi:MAG TPA: DUF2169 domain-containing protein [Pirellulales bacterium]|jgi:hypothetical protein|nr:DUF2169 domain-containing protein [Pirellulales bacterium]
MHLVNHTKFQAGYTMFTAADGRESIVVVAKATFAIPRQATDEPRLAAEQVPLVMCDEFTGEPGFSAPRYEIDFAPRKPRCDVLLVGSAYAPGGRATDRVTVKLQVGTVTKSFDVVGKRVYRLGIVRLSGSAIEPFTVMPISYDNAYGGVDRTNPEPAKHRWFPSNHAGVGYHPGANPNAVEGLPLPNTEETGNPVTSANGNYRPMALGPVGRAWEQRIKYAGAYDRRWLDEKFPFLPDDFDDRYFQAAPEDQQTDPLRGGEEVALANLTPQGHTAFRLPKQLGLPVLFVPRSGDVSEQIAVADTLLIEPDEQRFMICWRTSIGVRRTIREITEIIVGQSAARWREQQFRRRRAATKHRFPSLREMVTSARLTKRKGAR